MRELTQIRQAVIAALEEAGMTASAAFPDQKAKTYLLPVATVDVGTVQGKEMGFCNYLGEIYDDEAGTVREQYGKLLEGTILVEIRGKSAALCQEGCETAAEVLLGRLPQSIRTGELAWEAVCWEKETQMFLRRCTLHCQAVFIAQRDETEELFLDFRLKGVRTT